MRALLAGLLLACCWLAIHPAARGEVAERARVPIAFVPPDVDGKIFLGIFDARKRILRTLFAGADVSDFTIGLNGLITYWDGLDDAGKPAPKGYYSAHGYVVGAVVVEGKDFHFNDWYAYDRLPVEDVDAIAMAGDDLIVLSRGVYGSVFRISPDGQRRWSTLLGFGQLPSIGPLPAVGPVGRILPRSARHALAADSTFVVVGSKSSLGVYSARNGVAICAEGTADAIRCLAVDEGTLLTANAARVQRSGLPFLEFREHFDAPAELTGISANAGGLWAWSGDSASVWRMEGNLFERVSLSGENRILDLASANTAAMWVIAEAPVGSNDRIVRQYDATGALHKELQLAKSEPQAERIAASASGTAIALLERTPQSGRVRYLRRRESAPPSTESNQQVDWEVAFERSWFPCENFGMRAGKLVANAGDAPQRTLVEIDTIPTALDRAPRRLKLRATFDSAGSYLDSEDGLRLVQVSTQRNLNRVVVEPQHRRGAIRLYQGNRVAVEEFEVRRLDRIAYFDCGTFELR